jgi:hypothetical protein
MRKIFKLTQPLREVQIERRVTQKSKIKAAVNPVKTMHLGIHPKSG